MEIIEIFNKYNIKINEKQAEKFEKYYNFLIEENKKFNLTAITEKKEVFFKHFLDSVLAEKNITKNAKIIDIGSGAGFPAIPLKILRPDLQIVMVDSLNKRVNFLNQVINLLKLCNISAIHSRAEDYIKENREKFDFAVARAVAPLNTLLEYLLPYVKVGGKCLIYKSQKLEEELKGSQNALKILCGNVDKIDSFYIEEFDMQRYILVVDKFDHNPVKYPRDKNKPKTQPL